MSKDREFEKLSYEKADLKSHWYGILRHIKRDLAYIWDEDVKKDIKDMEGDLKKIEHIIKKLSSYYKKVDRKAYQQELKDINSLISCLKNAKPSEEWVNGAYTGLKKVIKYIEKGEIGLRQFQGNLHAHSQDNSGGVPISGSNCGTLAVAEIIRYAGTRMGQKFIAITDHSRDADPEGALGYWEPQ